MKEFVLTQPYATLEEMLNSAEVGIYKEELMQGNIEKYAIVSRIGNRYDLFGNKIDGFANNPFIVKEKVIIKGVDMKYSEIEKLIDAEVEKTVADLKAQHEQEIAELKRVHEDELATVKANAKAEAKEELLAKLNG